MNCYVYLCSKFEFFFNAFEYILKQGGEGGGAQA